MASDEHDVTAGDLAQEIAMADRPGADDDGKIQLKAKENSIPWMQFLTQQAEKGNGVSQDKGKSLNFSKAGKYLKLAKFMVNLLLRKDLDPSSLQVFADYLNPNKAQKGMQLLKKMGFPKPDPMGFSKKQWFEEKDQDKNSYLKKDKEKLGKFLNKVI